MTGLLPRLSNWLRTMPEHSALYFTNGMFEQDCINAADALDALAASAPQASQPPQGAAEWLQINTKRVAPWTDFDGKPIFAGDTIAHPSGEAGVVVFLATESDPGDQWRVLYVGSASLSRLCLQIGDKGRAVVVERAALAAPPQGASSLLREALRAFIEATAEGEENGIAGMASLERRVQFYDRIKVVRQKAVAALAASPLPAPQEPAALTEWRAARKAAVEAVEAYNAALRAARANDEVNGFGFTNVDREYQAMTEASNRAHGLVAPLLDALYAAPAPVDPESPGAPYTQLMSDSVTVNPISATQPASPARELTNVEIVTLGKDAFGIDPTFDGSLMKFARAVLAADRALREQGR